MIQAPPNQPGHFESALLPLPAAAAAWNFTVNHGRGTTPRSVEWVVVCLQTDNEFTPGDEVQIISGPNGTFNPTVWKNGSQTGWTFNGGLELQTYAKFTNALANVARTKWATKVYCTW